MGPLLDDESASDDLEGIRLVRQGRDAHRRQPSLAAGNQRLQSKQKEGAMRGVAGTVGSS